MPSRANKSKTTHHHHHQTRATTATEAAAPSPALLSSWKPPSSASRIGAVGKFKRPLALAAACRNGVEPCVARFCGECQPTTPQTRDPTQCCPHHHHTRQPLGLFGPKIHPELFDWLGDETLCGKDDRKGQTYAQFVDQQNQTKTAAGSTTIYLWDLDVGSAASSSGANDKATTTVDVLREFVGLYFGVSCRPVSEPLDDRERKKLRGVTAMSNKDDGETEEEGVAPRVLAGTVESILFHRREHDEQMADALAVVGVTSQMDLCATSADTSFEYGEACPDKGVAVVSLVRFVPTESTILGEGETASPVTRLRAMKILAHEIGHLLGMAHCIYYQCIMNGWAHLDELDESPVHLCPVCLRKLHHARAALGQQHEFLGADDRYKQLAKAMETEWEQKPVAGWYAAAAARCKRELGTRK